MRTDLRQGSDVGQLLTLVSQRKDGTVANDLAQDTHISGDGRFVGFASYATNLDPADTDAISDVYLKDIDTGDLTLVSIADDGAKGNDHSFNSAPADGGQSVVFQTQSTNFDPADTDPNDDLYVKRFQTAPVDANG